MKKILYILLIAVGFSCSDNLEQSPSDSLSEGEAITSVADLRLAVNGIYKTMVDKDGYCGDFGLYADGKGGEVDYLDANNQFAPIINLQTDRNSGFSDGFYEVNYVAIARINNILAVLEQVADKKAKEDEYKELVAQLYGLRAFLHFDVLRTFCPMPNLVADKTAAKSGIVIASEKYAPNQRFTRSTMQESYAFVKADFAKALEALSKTKAFGTDRVYGEIDYWAVKALKARMHLYLGEYDNALADAIDVINNSGYQLLTRDKWMASWTIEGADETLFELLVTDDYNAQRNSIGYYTSPEGYPEAAASEGFASFFETINSTDIRKESVKKEKNTDGDFEAYYVQKYRGRSGVIAPLYVNNPKVIRLSEVYYIAAEAVLNGGTAEGALPAVDYYNEVRANRIEGYTNATSVDINDILNERRIELFCENARVFDLIRTETNFKHPRFAGDIEYTDSRLIAKFPQRELDINKDF